MKKLLLLTACLIALSVSAQVFNTASTLKKGQFSVGFEPGVYANGDSDFSLFLHGGAGLTSNVDLGVKIGLLNGDTYIGGDVEFALGRRFSLSFGAHSQNEFGIDGTALFTFPLKKGIGLYTGFDADIWFIDDETYMPMWIPVGLQIKMKSNMAFLFEAEINVTDVGRHYIGGGLSFFF